MNALRLADLSVRAKLLGVAAIASVVALLLASAAIAVRDRVTFRAQKLEDLTTQAQILGSISSAALAFDDPKSAGEYLATLRARPDVKAAVLFNASGDPFATYRREGADALFPPVEGDGHRFAGDDLLLFRRITQGREVLGTVYLQASLGLRQRLWRSLGILLIVTVCSLGVALLLSATLSGRLSKPLLEVAQVARDVVEHQDYSQRVMKRGEDEVGVLVEAFNQMLGRIEQREVALSAANGALQQEVEEHMAVRDEVASLNVTLERRVAERTAELEAANKELESFSYSVSHDLRAPLRAIDGFAMLLQKHAGASFDATGQGHLDRVRSATQRMGHLIDDLLRLSRTTRSEMSRRELDLSELARGIAADLKVAAPEHEVEVSIAPGMRAYADPTLMRTVLENLLGNAWKFTAKQAESRVEVSSVEKGDETIYFVKDNGAGFDMRYVDKLFGAFQRLHAMTEYAGTGVGLANVQRIIHRHGGRVWAKGEPGRGATFCFTLSNPKERVHEQSHSAG
ncbi:MAG TPA: ATP-binding protein [Holophagaceae bacterium]|jgi:signal transduction histidine kinase|nr:ATP-binding protein [Holophagaceae bacterium]